MCLIAYTRALTISYCSPDNTGSNSVSSTYMSNGKCQDNCKGSYVFAVIQGTECWCSNYAPSDQVSTSSCNTNCPGYPMEQCGNPSQGLYGYFNLGGIASGTAGGSSSPSSSPSSTAEPSSSLLSSSTPTPASSTSPLVYTSIISVTGKASTILVTPTPASTSDSALGASTQSSSRSGGLSGGTVAGIVVGVAIIIGVLIGAVVFFWLRRRHQQHLVAASEGDSFASSSPNAKGNGSTPSRQVSQLSSAGLLTKPTRANTGGMSMGESNGGGTVNSDRNSTHMTVDQRLNPWAIYSNEDSRHSNVSLQDNQDYSRQLRVANPDP